MKRISIDPITRLEGHGKIDIFLDDQGDVANVYLQIPELRGFEQFCVGRPAEDMPNLTARICGVCPEAHHMAATKALDARVSRRSAADGQEAPRAVLQHLLRHRPHDALLRPGRTGLRHGPGRPGRRAEHPGHHPQGRHGHCRQGAQDAPRRTSPDRNDRRPQGPSQLGPARRGQPRHQRGTTRRNRATRPRRRRVRPILAQAVRGRRAGQQRLPEADHRRHLRPPHLQHGHGRREQLRELLRRPHPRHRPGRQGTRQVPRRRLPRVHRRAGRAVELFEVPVPQEGRLEGICRRRGLRRLQGDAACRA